MPKDYSRARPWVYKNDPYGKLRKDASKNSQRQSKAPPQVPEQEPESSTESSVSDDSTVIVTSESNGLDPDGTSSSKPKGSAASRTALKEHSTNIVPKQPSLLSKQSLRSVGSAHTSDDEEEADEVVPMPDEERRRIYKMKRHWNAGGLNLSWDDDLEALAAEEQRLEDHTLILKGLAAEVADKNDDDETIIAKVKQAGGWFGDLILRGEEDRTVPIYDTCLRLKEKIQLLLEQDFDKPENFHVSPPDGQGFRARSPMSKKLFCRALNCTMDSLGGFLKKEGVMGGAENKTYISAYCFFEKKRMWEGAEKSDAREACETAWWPKGLQLRDSNRGQDYIIPVGYDPPVTYINEDTGEITMESS